MLKGLGPNLVPGTDVADIISPSAGPFIFPVPADSKNDGTSPGNHHHPGLHGLGIVGEYAVIAQVTRFSRNPKILKDRAYQGEIMF